MDLKLQVKQSQILSQRMIQSAEILQMTSQELNTYVNDLALENPVIDIVEPVAGNDQKESIEQQQWLNSFNEKTIICTSARIMMMTMILKTPGTLIQTKGKH